MGKWEARGVIASRFPYPVLLPPAPLHPFGLTSPALYFVAPDFKLIKGSELKFSVNVVPKLIIFVNSLAFYYLGDNLLKMDIITGQ